MIRLAKLTDYGIALMTHFARSGATASLSARELADATGIPLPTVSKLLKALNHHALLQSQRGAHGGYTLSRDAKNVTIADIVAALEGPIAITECSDDTHQNCAIERSCLVRPHWQTINLAIRAALDQLTLADMAGDTLPPVSIPPRGTLPLL